jgi:hypothetical protein
MAFSPIKQQPGERLVIRYQITQASTGSVVDISGYSFQWGVKDNPADASQIIGPVAGSTTDTSNGKFQIVVQGSYTSGLTAPMYGKYGVVMFDSNNSMTPLTPADGVDYIFTWAIAS